MTFKQLNYNSLTDYNLTFRKLTSLDGVPKEIKGYFDCSCNKLTSLEYSPKIVKGGFFCSDNKLTTLEGGVIEVEENYNCSSNLLTNLKGSPIEIGGSFNCSNNKLVSLKGAPNKIKGDFNCNLNLIKDVKKEIIKQGIVAKRYITDEGIFLYKEIEEEMKKYNIKNKEKIIIQNNKVKINQNDFGLSI